MTLLHLTLLLASLTADPNTLTIQEFAKHWLEPIVPVKVNYKSVRNKGHIRFRPDGWYMIIDPPKRPFNMNEFAEFARHYVPPPGPNLAEILKDVTDPNLANFIKELMTQ